MNEVYAKLSEQIALHILHYFTRNLGTTEWDDLD